MYANPLFQDLELSHKLIKDRHTKNRNARLSVTFRTIRNQGRFSLLGDYPILSYTISVTSSLGIKFSRTQMMYALNCSDELSRFSKKEKSILVNQLIALQDYEVSRQTKNKHE